MDKADALNDRFYPTWDDSRCIACNKRVGAVGDSQTGEVPLCFPCAFLRAVEITTSYDRPLGECPICEPSPSPVDAVYETLRSHGAHLQMDDPDMLGVDIYQGSERIGGIALGPLP